MKSVTSIAISLAVAAILGISAGIALCHYREIRLDTELSVGDVLQFIAILAVFFLANHVYEGLHDGKRRETELLLQIVNDALASVEQVRVAVQACQGKDPIDETARIALQASLKTYANAVYAIEEALGECERGTSKPTLEKIKKDREACKDELTESPYPSRIDAAVVQNSLSRLDANRSRLRLLQLELARGL